MSELQFTIVEDKNGNKICRVPMCDKHVLTRGVCKPCYSIATQAVKRGLTSWKKLVENDKILPAGTKGRKRSESLNWMLEE